MRGVVLRFISSINILTYFNVRILVEIGKEYDGLLISFIRNFKNLNNVFIFADILF